MPEKQKKTWSIRELNIHWTEVVYPLCAGGAAYLLAGVIFCFGYIASCSMEPTYMTGSLFASTRLLDKEHMNRGDVVLFHLDDLMVCKRIVGLPGETITFVYGDVYIDGERYDESAYLDSTVKTMPSDKQCVFTVPADCYFIMGDNRGDSWDARFWDDPFTPAEDLVSRLYGSIPVPPLRAWLLRE